MNQLKYLLLIPVLASMLFYVSCTENNSENLSIAKKEPFTMYTSSKDGLNAYKSEKETYLDSYIGGGVPKEFTEISVSDLNELEIAEYIESKKIFEENFKNIDYVEFKIFKMNNKRKVIGAVYDFSKMKKNESSKVLDEVVYKTEEVSVMKIDQAPTFPECETGDKACFSKKIQKHFISKFNPNVPKNLGLSPGNKKIFIGFTIDKEGIINNIKVRAPHEEIKKEVIRVMEMLPKVVPGEQNGEKVAVKYSIPFTIIVE